MGVLDSVTVATRRKPTSRRLPHHTAGSGTGGNGPAGSSTSSPLQRPLRASSRLSTALQRVGATEHPRLDAAAAEEHIRDGPAGPGRCG